MKKVFFTLTIVALMIIGLSSCGSHEKCPAYSQIEQSGETPA